MSLNLNSSSGNASFVESNSFNRSHHLHIPASTIIFPSDKANSNKNDVLQNSTVESCKSTMPAESEPLSSSQLSSASSSEISSSTSSSLLLHFRTHSAQQNASMCTNSEHDTSSVIRNLSQTQIMNSSQRSKKWSGNVTPTRVCHGESSSFELLHDAYMHTSDHDKSSNVNNENRKVDAHETETITRKMENLLDQVQNEVTNKIAECDIHNNFGSVNVKKNSNNKNTQTDVAKNIENDELNIVNNNKDADTSESLSCNVEMPTELLFIDNADGTAYLTDVSICDDGSLLLHETVLLAQSVWSELTHELIEPNALKLSIGRDESKSPIPFTPSSTLLPHQIRWNEYEAKERTEVHEPLSLSHHTTSNKDIRKRKRPIRVARVVRERAVSRHDPNSNDKIITTTSNEERNAEDNKKNNDKENYSMLHNTDTSKKTQTENLLTKMQGNSINDWQLQATVLKYDDSIRRLNVSFVNDELSHQMFNCTNEEVYSHNTSRQRSASPTAINPDESETSQNDKHHHNNNNNYSERRSEKDYQDSENEDENDDDWSQWQPSTNVETYQASTSPSFVPTQHNIDHHPRTNTQTSRSLSSLTLSRTPVITLHTLHTEGWIPVHLVQHSDKLMKTPEKAEEVQVNSKLSIPSSTAKSMESCTLPNNSTVNTCTPPDFRRKPSDHKYYSTQNRLSLSPVPITPEGSVNIPRHTQRNGEWEMIHHNKLTTEQAREDEEHNLPMEEEECEECDEVSPEREGSLSRISAFCSIDNSSLATSLSMSTMASVRRRLNFSVNTSPLPNEQCQRYSAQTSMIVSDRSDHVHNRHSNSINNDINNVDNSDAHNQQKVFECKRNCTKPERRQASMSPLPCLQSLLLHENKHTSNNTENSTNNRSCKEDNEMNDDASSREASPERGAGTTPLLPLSVWSCNEIQDWSINNNGKHHNQNNKNFNTSVHSYAKRYPLASSTQIEEDPLKSSVSSMTFSPSASLSMSAAMQLSDLLTSLSFQRSMADSSMHNELTALQESLREFGISLSVPLSQSTCSTISTMESNCINNHVNLTNCIGHNSSACNNKNELGESCSMSQYSHPFVNFTQIFSEPLSSRLRSKQQNYVTTSLFSSSSLSSEASRLSSSQASQRPAWWHMNNKRNEKNNLNTLPNKEKHYSFHHKLANVQNQFQSEYMQRHSGENDSTQGSRTSSNFTTTYCRQPVRLSANMSRRSSYTSQNSTFSVCSNSNGASNKGNINTIKSINIENKCSNNNNKNTSYKVQQNGVISALHPQKNSIAPKQHHMDPESANFGNTNHSDQFFSSSPTTIDNKNVESGNTLLNDESTSASLSMRVCERVDFAPQDNNKMSVTENSNRDDGRNSNGIQWHSIKLPPKTRSQIHNKSKAAVHAQHQINFKNVMKARANKAGKNGSAHTESQRKHNNTLVGTVIPDTSVFLPFSPLSITPESSLNLQEWQPHNSETYQQEILTQENKMLRANIERNDINKSNKESNINSNSYNNDSKENEISTKIVLAHEYTGLHALNPSSVNVQTHDGKFSIEATTSIKHNVIPNESETVTTIK